MRFIQPYLYLFDFEALSLGNRSIFSVILFHDFICYRTYKNSDTTVQVCFSSGRLVYVFNGIDYCKEELIFGHNSIRWPFIKYSKYYYITKNLHLARQFDIPINLSVISYYNRRWSERMIKK